MGYSMMRSLYESLLDSDEQISKRTDYLVDFYSTLDKIIEILYKYLKSHYNGCYKNGVMKSYVFEFTKFENEDDIVGAFNDIRRNLKLITTKHTEVDGSNVSFSKFGANFGFSISLINFKGQYLELFIERTETRRYPNKVVVDTRYSEYNEEVQYFDKHFRDRLKKIR